MGVFIVKPDPDVDFYVRWSTIVDAPTAWGPRVEMMQLTAAAERLDRADLIGTSSDDPAARQILGHDFYQWGDDDFIVHEVDIPNRGSGCYSVQRGNLQELCRRLEVDEDPTSILDYDPMEDE